MRNIAPAVYRMVGALLELPVCSTEPYCSFIREAADGIGTDYADDTGARFMLVEAIKLNLQNRVEYPFEMLQRKYNLPVGKGKFTREKQKFTLHLAERLGWVTA